MGNLGNFFLQGKRLLFGKPENNDIPSNLDVIQFNSATQQWELVSGVIGNAVQSSSNVGTGEGVALARVGDDLPFRTLTTTSRISLTGSATEIEIDIGTLEISDINGLQTALDNLEPPFLISDITGLQTALDSKLESPIDISDVTNLQTELDSKLESPIDISDVTNLQTELDSKVETASNEGTGVNAFIQKTLQNLEFRTLLANAEVLITQNASDLAFSIGAIAQSKITGLVTALSTKIQTLTNVGTGTGTIAKPKVLVNVDIKTILAGAGITVNNLTDEIEIVNDNPTLQSIPPVFLMNSHGNEITTGLDYLNIVGIESENPTEADRQNVFPNACTLSRMTFQIGSQKDEAQTIELRINSLTVNQNLTIPASTTGLFQDLANTDAVANGDLVGYQVNVSGSGSFQINSTAIEVTE